MIEHVRNLDKRGSEFLLYCPFYCYEAFLCAALIVLKILKNDYFVDFVDTDFGRRHIDFSVSALRKLSVANNDLSGRLSDVLAYLWTHIDPSIAGGRGPDGLQLKVKSRMSMSVVYDLLWRWREQFRNETEPTHALAATAGKKISARHIPALLTDTDRYTCSRRRNADL